jgi:hypothetical protein
MTSLEEYFNVQTTDHLLPKGEKYYPWLECVPSNKVPACRRCNALKAGWDPNFEPTIYEREKHGESLTEPQQAALIARGRAYLDRRRREQEETFREVPERLAEAGYLAHSDGDNAEALRTFLY